MANYLGGGGFDPQAYMMRKLMDEMFEDKTPEYRVESTVMGGLAKTASSAEEFEKLDKVLDDYWKRNNSHGADIEAQEIKQRADYSNRKNEFYQYKEAHSQVLGMINPNYKISGTDKDGGIQNVDTSDVASWDWEKITKELGKVNRIKDSFELASGGYKYSPKDTSNTSKSLARDINQYSR